MNQLKESFAKLLKKPTKTRSDIVSLKHEAQKCNPQISGELAQILKDTSCELDPCKIEKLKKLYNKHFQTC